MKNVIRKVFVFAFIAILPIGILAVENDPPVENTLSSTGTVGNSVWGNLDINYMDHGLVYVNGNRIITNQYSMLVNKWQQCSDRSLSEDGGGVVIENYLFSMNKDGLLTVKDMRTGIVKELDKKANPERFGATCVYTAARGFVQSEIRYNFAVYCTDGKVYWYEFKDTALKDAFEKGKDKIVVCTGGIYDWYPWTDASKYKVLSLIRVPSLQPSNDSKYFGKDDFIVAITYHKNTPSKIYYSPLPWNGKNSRSWSKGINDRNINYAGYIRDKGLYVDCIDAISGTAYIGKHGIYTLGVGINSWGAIKGKEYVAMAARALVISYKNDQYSVQHIDPNVKYHSRELNYEWDSYLLGHYAVAITSAARDASDTALELVGFCSPYYRRDEKMFLFRWEWEPTHAYYDWSDATLAKYGADKYKITPDPKSAQADKDRASGMGLVVLGMVLCVPPHPELYKGIVKSYANVKSAIESTVWQGTVDETGSKISLQSGSCTLLAPFASSASYAWTVQDSSKASQTFSSGSDTKLENYRENMIIGIMPDWDLKCSVLQSSGYNVRYANDNPSDKAYVTMAAVMDPGKSGVSKFFSSTENPGKNINGQEIVLTKGMKPYSASGSNSRLYDDLMGICRNLEDLADDRIIDVIATTEAYLTSSSSDDSVWFNKKTSKENSITTTNSFSFNLTCGVARISTLSTDVTASTQKSYGTSVSDSKGAAFGYKHNPADKEKITQNLQLKPVMYWIPVKKLKSKYSSRTDKVDLTFIPDYMWNNSMDYWLMAYSAPRAVHMH